MGKSVQSVDKLIEKIRHLPAARLAEVENFVDFLQARAASRKQNSLEFPVISVGCWPQNLSLRREDMYGNDGR